MMAEACAAALWANDQASQGLGMTLVSVAPGEAVMAMPVTERMLNGHGTCHGGFIFTLADSAFAFACNTYNEASVAAQCQISFLRPARLGDVLTAHATERHREGRAGIYDISVTAGPDVVAEFRGHSRTTGKPILHA